MNRLHPATMIVAFLPKLYDAFRSVLPFLAISFISGKGDNTELFIGAIGVLGGFGAIAAYWTTRYGFEDANLVCTSGWLFKRDRRIPLSQIQNVNIKQGVLERLFKVVTLEVETAASSGAEIKLQVITESAADDLKARLALVPEVKALAQIESDLVYKMSRQDLLLGAMTENQGGQIIFALIGTVGAAAIAQVAHRFVQIKEVIPGWFLWIGIIALIAGIWGLGWIYGGIQYTIKFAHFAVRSEPGIFRITHGFFTKLQYAVRVKRVEMATVSSTVWQRMVKCCTVRVGTAGTFGEQGTMVPIAMMLPESKTNATLSSVLPAFDESKFEWQPLPRFYFVVTSVQALVSMAIIGALAWFVTHSFVPRVFPDVLWAVPAVVGIIFASTIVNLIVGYRRAGYAITEAILATRMGFFRRIVTYMPISRIDTIGTTNPSWWWKRGVTKFVANAMVHVVPVPMITSAEADRIRELIVRRPKLPTGFSLDLIKSE
ncbi:MAG: PH domain-containing protein [Chlorobia bacterium]|nr:PH domain-containing protein [Fimbriimonadaceae bacterium]